jgi:iron complex outermembrane receptor protein
MSREHRAAIAGAASIGILAAIAPAHAAAQVTSFHIPAAPLATALQAYAKAANRQIIFSKEAVEPYRTAPLEGEFTPEQALHRLLQGTSLVVASTPSGVLVVRPPPARVIRAAARAIAQPPPQTPVSPAVADAQPPSPVLEEVVVTATRREENIQNVPVAVTAVSAAGLAARQITNLSGLQRLAPSLTTAPFGDATSPLIAIRGLAAQDITMAVDPAVGIYLDGVYLGRSTGGNLNLVDVSRVEVLRGPQGTLFGRNTIGGAISITPNHPDHRFDADIETIVGDYSRWEVTGMINVPVNDRVAFRLAASHRQHGGYARSSVTGAELNAENLNYVRPSVSVDLGEKWNLLLSGDYTNSRNNGQWIDFQKAFPIANVVAGLVTKGAQTAQQFVDPFTTHPASQTAGPFTSRNWGVAGILSGDIAGAHFKSITSYREVHRSLNNFDQDGSPFELLQLKYNNTNQHQFSQEAQLYGKAFDSRLDWIAGAYFFTESGRDTVALHSVYPLVRTYNITDGEATNRNYAVYGQLTYALTDQLSLVGGVRYAQDTRSAILFNRTAGASPDVVLSCVVTGALVPDCRVPLPERRFHYFPATVGLNYKPADHTLLYAKWSRGFRSGGYNTRGTTDAALQPYDPESDSSYEIGAKLEFLRRFRLNAAAYLSDYSDIQILTALSTTSAVPIALTQNAGDARIKGVELEGDAAFGRLRLSGTLALTDAHYTKLLPGVLGLQLNSPFVLTPKTQLSAAADYTQPTRFGSVVFHLDYSYRSKVWFQPSPPGDPGAGQGAYGLLNASITGHLNDHVAVSVFGQNLGDKHYFQRTNAIPGAGFLSDYPGDPRTWGVSASYRY